MRRAFVAALVSVALPQLACQGQIGSPGDPGPVSNDRPGPNDPADPNDPTDPTDPVTAPPEAPAPSPRLVRLTHAQWERSVQSLLRLDADEPTYVENLRIDTNQTGFLFGNNALSLSVDDSLWSGYERAATQLATDVTTDSDRLARIVPPPSAGDDDTRARQFIESFGLRAHRRPLTSTEVDDYFAVYTAGQTLFPPQAAFEAGIRLTLQAFLSSPMFVYRFEGSTVPSDGIIPLDPYEVASRLSFFLWNASPDQTLLDAAAAGELSTVEQVRAQAERMLADPQAEDVVARFHDALLMVNRYASVNPSPTFFSDTPADYPTLLERENDLFIRAMFRDGKSWAEVLTTNETFVNQDLAAVYGLAGTFGADFQRVTLDPNERSGLFTHLGFLASNATSVNPDPIHRGVYLSKHIACNSISAPPNDIPPLPPAEGRTNRETVEAHTEVPGTNCAGCHTTLINPFGWPFEGYDAIGAVRTEDNGQPVDTTASVLINGEFFDVDDALALSTTLASNASVHECYAEHWIEYALGRPLVDGDTGIVHVLTELSQQGGSIRNLLARLVESPAFLARSTEEL